MTPKEFDTLLDRVIADARVSRGERKTIRKRLKEATLDTNQLAVLRSRTFDAARDELGAQDPNAILDWLEDVVKLLVAPSKGSRAKRSEAFFSPGADCRDRIVGLLRSARRCVDICVFTITDNRITDEIADAHHRGVKVRVLTDDAKASDLGSDVDRLSRAGIPVVCDGSGKHMHHKFALFDGETLLTGSYNWTRSAADQNEENIVILRDARLIRDFQGEFDRLWSLYR